MLAKSNPTLREREEKNQITTEGEIEQLLQEAVLDLSGDASLAQREK